MLKHKVSSSTGKLGVTLVRGVVEGGNCLFHKIDQENDLGIDGIVELIRNEEPLNKQFAVQVKTGESYFDTAKQECVFPVDNHYAYWNGYPLSVYGIVVVPSLKKAFWVDIKRYFKGHPNCTVIRFSATEANTFNDGYFTSIFVPTIVKEVPDIPLKKALTLLRSHHEDELLLGMVVLFRRFCNKRETWDAFVEYFISHAADKIPGMLIYFFAHVPWHGDIWGFGEQLTEETRTYVRGKFASLGKTGLIKLLSMVDEENMIARGTIGQSVEAIVSSLPNCVTLLSEVLKDKTLPLFIREVAGIIFAIHKPQESIHFFQDMAENGSWYMAEMAAHIKESGELNPYM
ncbi:MAG: DUF4365 domain-containing protein [Candidatus Theseobacter exili]|nr:DUF4365 domain-containing protein [Candidatus Theseobacter exili]